MLQSLFVQLRLPRLMDKLVHEKQPLLNVGEQYDWALAALAERTSDRKKVYRFFMRLRFGCKGLFNSTASIAPCCHRFMQQP